MPIQVTKSKFEAALQKVQGLNKKVKEANKKAESVIMRFVEIGVTGGVAGGFGYIDGRWGGSEVFGTSGALLFSGLAHGLAFFELGGDVAAKMLHAAGNGAFSNYTSGMAQTFGRINAIRAKELNPITGLRKGLPGFKEPTDDEIKKALSGTVSGNRMLSDQDLRAMAAGA